MAKLTHDGTHRYIGYMGEPVPNRNDPGHFILVRGINFADPNCRLQTFDIKTRKRFRQLAIQVFNVTEEQGLLLHTTRH